MKTSTNGDGERSKNPKRVAAGRRNRRRRKGLTDTGRARLRETAHAHQPWRHATGPRTPEGKAAASANGRYRQRGPISRRELLREVADINELIASMRELRS